MTEVMSQGQRQEMDTMKVNIGLSEDQRRGIADVMKMIYSDQMIMFLQTRNYYFNVVSPRFTEMRSFFKTICEEILRLADCSADELRKIGHRVPGTNLNEFTKFKRIPQVDEGAWPDAHSMIRNLLQVQEMTIINLQKDRSTVAEKMKDPVVEDFILDLIRAHKRLAWNLRAHLEIPEKVGPHGTETRR